MANSANEPAKQEVTRYPLLLMDVTHRQMTNMEKADGNPFTGANRYVWHMEDFPP